MTGVGAATRIFFHFAKAFGHKRPKLPLAGIWIQHGIGMYSSSIKKTFHSFCGFFVSVKPKPGCMESPVMRKRNRALRDSQLMRGFGSLCIFAWQRGDSPKPAGAAEPVGGKHSPKLLIEISTGPARQNLPIFTEEESRKPPPRGPGSTFWGAAVNRRTAPSDAPA